jgi:hypothetical protein
VFVRAEGSKNVGYLITPTKKPGSTQPIMFTTVKQRTLRDDEAQLWFERVASLLQYLKGDVEYDKFNKQLQQLALSDVYPNTQYLKELKRSDEKVRPGLA